MGPNVDVLRAPIVARPTCLRMMGEIVGPVAELVVERGVGVREVQRTLLGLQAD